MLEDPSEHAHGEGLQKHLCGISNAQLWAHLPFGPFETSRQLFAGLAFCREELGWLPFAIRLGVGGEATGMASLMRIRSEHGSAEIGSVVFGERLQKTSAATEAIFLLAHYVFDTLGYRRLEWKCDDRNEASKKAAIRFGFRFEGVFRNDMIVKGKSRDTAWFAMTDHDWHGIRAAYLDWLDPGNFDDEGRQRSGLRQLIDQGV